MPMSLFVGDRVILKKPHPCGTKEFTILRTGADFRIKCDGCSHEVWIPRPNLEKRIRQVTPGPNAPTQQPSQEESS